MENLISVGKILNFHGIAGWMKAGYSNASVIENLKKVVIVKDEKEHEFNIESVKFHKNYALIKLKEINSINDILPYKGQKIYVKKEIVQDNLKDDEFLVDELIGLNVFDNNEDFLGVVSDVRTSGANDILCVKSEEEADKTYLIPFVKEIVPIVDIKGKKIIIKPIEGLL